MRIQRVSVTRFGPLHDLELDLQLPSGGGLVVVEGPNEAGKSTLLRFIRSLLFGNEPAEGALVVEHHGARYRIGQRGGRRTLAVTDLSSSRPADAALLQRMVGNLDGTVYRQIFAFGLAELQELAALTGAGVQERIFSAAVAGAGRSVREVQRDLGGDIEQLWRPRAACTIRDEAQALRRILGRVREAEQSVSQYERLRMEEDRLTGGIQERGAEIERLRNELRRCEILIELGDRWRKRLEARAHLADAPAVDGIPTEAPARVRELRAQTGWMRQGADALAAEVADLERRAGAQIPQADLLAVGGLVVDLAALLAVQRQRLEEDLPRLSHSVAEADELIAAALRPLGAGWSEDRLGLVPYSGLPTAELEAFTEEFAQLNAADQQSASRRRERADTAEKAEAQVAALRAEGADQRWLQAASEIRRLHRALDTHRARIDRLQPLETEARDGEADLGAVLGRLGPAWDGARSESFASRAEWRARAQAAQSALEEAAEGRRQQQTVYEAAERLVASRRQDLEALARPARDGAAVERELEAQKARGVRLEGLGGTLQEWRQSQQDEQTRALGLQSAQASLRPSRGWAGAAVTIGIALLLAAWVARSSPLAAAALLVGAVVLTAVHWPRRAASTAVDSARTAHEEAARRVQALAQRIQADGERAGVGVDLGTLHAALGQARDRTEALARELEACRQRERADQALQQAREHLEEGRAGREAAQRREGEALASWRGWCEGHGVPSHVRPADLPALLTDIERAAELARHKAARQREREELSAAIQGWRDAVGRLAEPLPTAAALPAEEAVAALQAEADRAGRLHELAQAQEEARRRLQEASQQDDEVRRTMAERDGRWRAWCAQCGLPAVETPEDARAWLGEARLALDRIVQARAHRSDLEGLRQRLRDWERRAADLLGTVGRPAPAPGMELVRAVEQLAADHETARKASEARDEAQADLEERQRQLGERRREIEERQEALARILEACGVTTQEQLSERLAWQEQRHEWQRTAAETEDELRQRAGRDAASLAALLDEDAPLRWEAERERLRERLPALEREMNDSESGLHAQLAAARNRRLALEESGDIATLRLQAEQVRSSLSQSLRRWVVCRLADALISDTLQDYERNHVPEVLRSASARFAAVTAGRYGAVRAVEAGRLLVDTAGGDVLDAAGLSRGTQEQLYLVVRLGLVDSFSRQSESLPLILDDVLVNADPERRQGLLRVLVEASRDHQTFLLTCHPEVSASVLAAVPEAQHVVLQRIGASAGTLREASAAAHGPEREIAAGAGEAAASEPRPRTAPSGPAPYPVDGRADRSEEAQRVLECLRAAGRPLGRRALVAASAIAEAAWPGVIRTLLDRGLVIQRGARRGAVYGLPAGM